MQVNYVSGPPFVTHGDNGNVLVSYPTSEDAVVTLSFRTDEAYMENDAEKDRAYLLACAARDRRRFPQMFDGPTSMICGERFNDPIAGFGPCERPYMHEGNHRVSQIRDAS